MNSSEAHFAEEPTALQNLNAERSVLGTLLLHADAVPEVSKLLNADDFICPRHQTIYRALLDCYEDRGATDPLTVGQELHRRDQLPDAGGHDYLLDLQELIVSAANVAVHAGMVVECRRNRDSMAILQDAANAARCGQFDAEATIERLQKLAESQVSMRAGGQSPLDVLSRWASEGPLVHIPTGIAALDDMTGGGPTLGTRVYINGAPNAGKTALIVQVADNFMAQGLVVGFLAIDEEPDDMLMRFLQRRGWSRQQCEIRDEFDLRHMREAAAQLGVVFYDSTWTIERAAADLAAIAKKQGKRVAFFIDSIQSTAIGDDRTSAVTGRVYAARSVASKYRMLVWSTSEMNRAAYRSAVQAAEQNKMAAGADSRSIEFQARILLDLASVQGDGDRVELRVVKNKLGRDHLPGERGIFLRIDRTAQQFTEEAGYQPLDTGGAKDAAKAKEALLDQAALAEVMAEHPGQPAKDLSALFRSRQKGGTPRFDVARAGLVKAIVKIPGKATAVHFYLDGSKVSEAVLGNLSLGSRGKVLSARPPAPPADPNRAELTRTDDPSSGPKRMAEREANSAPIGGSSSPLPAHAAGGGEEPEEAEFGSAAFDAAWRAAGIAPARDIGEDMARFHAECKAAGIVTPGERALARESASRRESARAGASSDDGMPEKPKHRRKPKAGGAA